MIASGWRCSKASTSPTFSIPDKLNGAVALRRTKWRRPAMNSRSATSSSSTTIGYRNTPYVVNQIGGAFIDIPDFLDSRMTVEGCRRRRPLTPIGSTPMPRNIDGETERMAHDRGIGVVAPDFVLDKAIGDCRRRGGGRSSQVGRS